MSIRPLALARPALSLLGVSLLGVVVPSGLLLAGAASGQSVILPDSTVRTVCSFSHTNGDLEAAGYMDLDDGAIPTNRSYQCALVNNELWFTDDVLMRITRWNRYGTVQLGSIDTWSLDPTGRAQQALDAHYRPVANVCRRRRTVAGMSVVVLLTSTGATDSVVMVGSSWPVEYPNPNQPPGW